MLANILHELQTIATTTVFNSVPARLLGLVNVNVFILGKWSTIRKMIVVGHF